VLALSLAQIAEHAQFLQFHKKSIEYILYAKEMSMARRHQNQLSSCRSFVGGSDARIIMGDDEAALLRLWHEKRGEIEPEDLSDNLIVQLGLVTENLNRLWYERNTGQTLECVQHRLRHTVLRWMGATLDGMVLRQRGGIRGQIHAAVVFFR
jgi:predicted phage-related endonuclease